MNKHLYLILAVLVTFSACKKSPIYIAHAGGEIDGHKYTNCMEAVQLSISKGITHIELDLALTSDNQLVALHDWEFFHAITNHGNDYAEISLDEFMTRKIHGRYTPITWQDIDTLMTNHPNLHLVTDKISSPEIIKQYFSAYRDRVLVECFTYDDYLALEKDGYYCMYSRYPLPKEQATMTPIMKLKKFLGLYTPPFASKYAFWYLSAFPNERISTYDEGYGDMFAVFTMSNRTKADSLARLDSRIKYVYIDNVE